jgi:endothelin-converting enzyme/putative endopeptidase
MDKSIDPCTDFYQYSCGGWQRLNPTPPDRTAWSVYGKLYEDNLRLLRGLLENSATSTDRDAITQKIGDFYGSCTDEAEIEKRGISTLKPELDEIASIQSTRDLPALVGHIELAIPGSAFMFGAGSIQDPDNTDEQIALLDQGGIGLPDRDYYTKQDAKSKEIRDKYVQHVQKVFALLGDSPAQAKKNADVVMRLESSLAKASWTRTERRDPYKLKHKMTIPELTALAPAFGWTTFFKEMKAPHFQIVNVSAPAFFKELNSQLTQVPIEDWKNYLRFELANVYSPYLSKPFVMEDFEFYSKYLRGAQELEPRWKRCVEFVDNQLPEALGQVYVRQVFSPEIKQHALDMVDGIEKAMELRITQLAWMSPDTKRQALFKLHAIRNKIGYPDKWRDYSSVMITKQNFTANVRNTIVFESLRQLNKIGQPTDRSEWYMSAPTVDAYYNPLVNDINFPAGVLQPPLFDLKMDDAPNYGDTGGTIGHELTHAFDDEGSQFDAKGNLKNWWTAVDAKKFAERTQCVDDQYSKYISVDDVHINGKLTLGENVADLGGEILAYIAWKEATKNMHLEPVDGLTPDQRFFIGFAQWDCANERPEQLREWAITNPHSPARFRINGVVVNMPEFAAAFSCKAGQAMVAPTDKICKVW